MVINGSDIIVYIDKGTGETSSWTPVAYSTSHKLNLSAETAERAHKDIDNPLWPKKYVKKLSGTITCETLVTDEANKESWDNLNTAFKAAQEVRLKYAPKDSKIAAGDKYEEGMFIITALERNDPTNEDSTISATFESSGAIDTKSHPAA